MAIAIVVINVLVLGPLAYIYKRHISDYETTVDKVNELVVQINDVRKYINENFVRTDDNTREEQQLQQQINTLDKRIYELPNRHTPRAGSYVETR